MAKSERRAATVLLTEEHLRKMIEDHLLKENEVGDGSRSLASCIARLKGGPGRPNIKPSGMEQATEPKPAGSSGNRGSTRSKLLIHEERTLNVAAPPRGSRFKGYTSFVVQDLVIRPHVVNFRCERWQTPDGGTMTAPLPAGINGHFGPQLRRFVLAQYHQGQMTVPRLVTLLRSLGIFISKRQVVRLLIESQDNFLAEARDVLRAGLSSAAWITVDDTGARHKATNGFCTQMGNRGPKPKPASRAGFLLPPARARIRAHRASPQ